LLLIQNDATAKKLPKNTATSVNIIKEEINTVRIVADSLSVVSFAGIFLHRKKNWLKILEVYIGKYLVVLSPPKCEAVF
jgi:hypothetical protein